MTTLTITNPTRTRKWGFGWNAGVSTDANGDWQILQPAAPDYTGTFATVQRHIAEDANFQAVRSGGTYHTTEWFYDGKPVVNMNSVWSRFRKIDYMREYEHKSGWICPITVELED